MTKYSKMVSRKFAHSILLCTASITILLSYSAVSAFESRDTALAGLKNVHVSDYEDWMKKYAGAQPDFKPGDVLTAKDLERLRPFIPPGYFEQFNFPDVHFKIVEPYDDRMHPDFVKCTEKYGRQVKLNPDGSIQGYRCGQPFPNDEITLNDPKAGIKAAWNFEHHWQNYGFYEAEHQWAWVRPGGSHQGMVPNDAVASADDPFFSQFVKHPLPKNINKLWGGGGTFERTLSGWYKRTFMSHLAQLDGGSLPGGADFEFKEWTNFSEPFDIRGTAFIVYRYNDPYRPDDAWAFVPTLRRVRRISAEVKSDSLLGTDLTIEDFYGFAGRELDWNWKFLGTKYVLNQYNPRETFVKFWGPDGMLIDDVWELRKEYVILRTPKSPRHPYSAAIMYVDPQSWMCFLELAFDRSGKLWKVIPWIWEYTEMNNEFPELNKGAFGYAWLWLSVFDVQNSRGTTITTYGAGLPSFPIDKLMAVYDVNRLEQSHR
jgi:hypothetical protein